MQKAYKIFEVDNNKIKNLFKGINYSREIKPDKWHEAELKWGRDGSNSTYYLTGIHCLPSKKQAIEYLNNFRVPKKRVIAEVYIIGNRRKPTNENVILAEKLFLPQKEFKRCINL